MPRRARVLNLTDFGLTLRQLVARWQRPVELHADLTLPASADTSRPRFSGERR